MTMRQALVPQWFCQFYAASPLVKFISLVPKSLFDAQINNQNEIMIFFYQIHTYPLTSSTHI
jgi:hypothetical protein